MQPGGQQCLEGIIVSGERGTGGVQGERGVQVRGMSVSIQGK